jgi:hypothetical protein
VTHRRQGTKKTQRKQKTRMSIYNTEIQ